MQAGLANLPALGVARVSPERITPLVIFRGMVFRAIS
jgi:hypothetical protein